MAKWLPYILIAFSTGIVLLPLYQKFPSTPISGVWFLCIIGSLLAALLGRHMIDQIISRRIAQIGYSKRQMTRWWVISILSGLFLAIVTPVINPFSASIESNSRIFQLLYLLSSGGLIGFGLYTLSVLLTTTNFSKTDADKVGSRYSFIYFALPMLVTWTFYLLAFFPGIMNQDSLHQWAQMISGVYNDWHPAFHTMSNWLITRLWLSPAAVALSQIIILSLIAGMGLQFARNAGAPLWVVWIVDLLFTFSPVNSTMSIALWKDIPFSIAVLGFSLILLFIALTHGKWLTHKYAGVLLGSTAALVSLYRHNGIPVVIVSMIVLLWAFWPQRRSILLSIGLFLALYLFVRGPLYEITGVDRSRAAVNRNVLLIHHIAAYLDAGVPLTKQDAQILEKFQRLGRQWDYYCYNVEPSIYNPRFNWTEFSENGNALAPILYKLILRAPRVEIEHVLCVGSLVWRIAPPPEGYLYTNLIRQNKDGMLDYIEANDMGLTERSLLPNLQGYLFSFLKKTKIALIWRPAIYLYLGIFCTIIGSIRRRNKYILLFILPSIISSSLFAIINVAQYFRYQYPVYLVGLFSIVLIFLPKNRP